MSAIRSRFEAGSTRWAVRRAQWAAMGISAEEMERPKIAVVNSSSQLSVCFQHLDGLSVEVQTAVRAAGGLPFEIRTAAPSDFVTSAGRSARYLLPTRDLIVNDIEVVVEGAQLDGMVCLSSCDKTTPAHIMAAVRLDVPTIVVACGYQGAGPAGHDIDDVYESVGKVAAGTLSVEELGAMAETAISGPGVCAGLGTANSMHILAEALGIALPGSTPVRAGSTKLQEICRCAGARSVELAELGLRPRAIVTEAALHNAVTVALAVGASVNVVRHLQAIAVEADLSTDIVELVERLGKTTPLLCGIRPNGPVTVDEFDAAGGTLALLRRLHHQLVLDARCVDGRLLGAVLEGAADPPAHVIRTLEEPYAARPGLAVLRGTLAPEGAIVKKAALADSPSHFVGPAMVFECEEVAIEALGDGSIQVGDVVVLAGLGPRGGPGTVFAAGFAAALAGTELAGRVAVVTDGELSGLNRGIVIGQVMPEAAEGGPLGLVRTGDVIRIDLERFKLDLEVDEQVLEARRQESVNDRDTPADGWLGIYGRLVGPLSRGAVLGDRSTG